MKDFSRAESVVLNVQLTASKAILSGLPFFKALLVMVMGTDLLRGISALSAQGIFSYLLVFG